LDYEALILGMAVPFRFSDSGGRWLNPGFDDAAARFDYMRNATPLEALQQPSTFRQLHMLIHPDWWADAFAKERMAA
jgi:hypothetical protein